VTGQPLLDFATFYHVGLVVPDMEAAIAEHERMSLKFEDPLVVSRPAKSPEGEFMMHVRACYALPPAGLEIVQEMPGTIWTAGEQGRLHHLAFVPEDVSAQSARLEEAGWPRVAWSDVGWVYHASPFGYYIEFITQEMRARHP
jgi:hypothetical protein